MKAFDRLKDHKIIEAVRDLDRAFYEAFGSPGPEEWLEDPLPEAERKLLLESCRSKKGGDT